jgi:5-(aminomethyl)-3-furanmethanol phosphate kinase
MNTRHVIKLGGSLLDLPDVLSRLARFVEAEPAARRLIVIGGGDAADVVRLFDAKFGLDEEAAHWLAIRAMELNAHCIAAVMKDSQPRSASLVSSPDACVRAWERDASSLLIMDPLRWLQDEHARGVTIPHRWSFTSDSIAAHVATVLGAERLTLLKSTLPAEGCDLRAAAAAGVIDGDFEAASASVPWVELVNLRAEPAARRTLRARA